MKLDEKNLDALKSVIEALDKPTGAIPAEILKPLISATSVNTKLRIDVAASKVVGAPVVMIEPKVEEERLLVLTPRQRDVAMLIIEGLSNIEIADRLGISVATVKDHVHAILDRFSLSSRLALVAFLRR